MAPTPTLKGPRPALQADFVCIVKKCMSWSWRIKEGEEGPPHLKHSIPGEKCQNSGLSPKLPWGGGAEIGLAVWQEVNTHQMPLQQGKTHHLPLASSASACPSGQFKLLFVCGLYQPQQVVEPSPNSRACWATSLFEKRKHRWSAFGQGLRAALQNKRAARGKQS